MSLKRLKIGLFIDTYFPVVDGVVMVVHNYATRLSKLADVTVFCPADGWKLPEDTYTYQVVRTRAIHVPLWEYNLPIVKQDVHFMRQLEKSELDLVDIHSPFAVGQAGLEYAKKHHVPSISHMHSQYHRDFYRATHSEHLTELLVRQIMKVFNGSDECWALNRDMAKILMEYGAKKMPVLRPNGTDLVPLEMPEDELWEQLNEKFGLQPNVPLLLFVGRLNRLKNILFLADSLAVLRDLQVPFQMCYVGEGPDQEALEIKLREHRLSDRVKLLGKVTDRETLAMLYAGAKLFLFPSYYDASSLVQIEAASQHTPTVFLENAPTACTVENEISGFVIPNDETQYAKAVASILSDSQRYQRVADGAFRDLYHPWSTIVQENYCRYLQLVEENQLHQTKKLLDMPD